MDDHHPGPRSALGIPRTGQGFFEDVPFSQIRRFLGQVADPNAARECDGPLVGQIQAPQNFEEGGFSRAVGPHEGVAVPGVQLERNTVENDLLAKGLVQILHRQHKNIP